MKKTNLRHSFLTRSLFLFCTLAGCDAFSFRLWTCCPLQHDTVELTTTSKESSLLTTRLYLSYTDHVAVSAVIPFIFLINQESCFAGRPVSLSFSSLLSEESMHVAICTDTCKYVGMMSPSTLHYLVVWYFDTPYCKSLIQRDINSAYDQ